MFLTVIGALNEGFLQTLKLFAVTLIGALPLGLAIAFGSMSRWTPFRRLGIWMQRRLPPRGGEWGVPRPVPGAVLAARYF